MPDLTRPGAPGALTLALAQAGLIQFGRFFQPDGSAWPVALNLRWLPSYPALLREVAAALSADILGFTRYRSGGPLRPQIWARHTPKLAKMLS